MSEHKYYPHQSTFIRFKKREEIELLNLSTITSNYDDICSKVKDFLLESSLTYPSIGDWWDTRVVPGLKNKERFCHTIIINGEIAGLSITKRNQHSSKLCTFKVREKYRGSGIGQYLLFSTLRKLISMKCSRVHYTISEDIMSQCGSFFSAYGFALASWEKGRYVKGMDELLFSASTRVLMKEITVNTKKDVLLSIKPEFADKIERGEKLVEFRRKFSSEIKSAKALFYVSNPVREIRFTADICDVIKSDPLLLWHRFQYVAGVDFNRYINYFKDLSEGNALVLSNIKPLTRPVTLENLKCKLTDFRPPQSYKILKEEDPLFPVVSPWVSK